MNNRDWQKRFDEKFVDRKVKQVDTSNSIVIYPWKHPHSHQSQEVKAFIQAELNQAREAERQRIEKELEGMEIEVQKDNGLTYPVGALHKTYNQALAEMREKLKERGYECPDCGGNHTEQNECEATNGKMD